MRIISNEKNAWQAIKNHYNEHKVGNYFLRREFKEKGFSVNGAEVQMSVIDQYTLILRRAGYLKDVDKGVYKKVKKIPKELKITVALKEAYPPKRVFKGPNWARPMKLSPELNSICNFPNAVGTRTEMIKAVWNYIRENRLQHKENSRTILMIHKLSGLTTKKQISLFDLTKVLNKHMTVFE